MVTLFNSSPTQNLSGGACPYCPYEPISPDDFRTHLFNKHGITRTNAPQQLQYLYQSGGYYEAPDPLRRKSQEHQINAQLSSPTNRRLYNPTTPHANITPTAAPDPWIEVDPDHFMYPEVLLKETPNEKVWASAQLSPGHGVLIIKRIVMKEKNNLLNMFSDKVDLEPEEEVKTPIDEYLTFDDSRAYTLWKNQFFIRVNNKVAEIRNMVNAPSNEEE